MSKRCIAVSPVVRAAAVAVATALFAPVAAGAQQGAIIGTIVADSGGKPIGGATVRMPTVNRGSQTNWTGDYAIEGLPAGRYAVIAEAPGFAAESIDVDVPAAGAVSHDFKLKRGGAAAAVAVAVAAPAGGAPAAAAPVTMSARLQAFEKRRAENKGMYLTRDKLVRGGRLIDVLRPIIRGSRFQSMPDGSTKLVSTRQVVSNALSGTGDKQLCFVQVWVDGTLIGGQNAGSNAPSMALGGRSFQGSASLQTGEVGLDFNPLESASYDAVEYYADPGATPAEYRTDGARCGTLVLWTHTSQ